ncbi:MAG TPA: alpha/beta hydrolase [Caulobacteraceae bacterium]|jgi:pimeloyl-ACP methyl ester carboxylesterase
MSGWADRWWTSAEGLRLHARDYPASPGESRLPVVCIHGLTRNARDFEDLAPWIAARERRVIAVDIRGRGGSARDPNPANYQPVVYAQDLARLFGALGLAQALFVGTSMGGLITLAVSAMLPRIVAGAVLNDIGPYIEPEGLARLREYVGKPVEVVTWDEAADYARRVNEVAFRKVAPDQWPRMARRLFAEGADGRPVLDYDPAIAEAVSSDTGEPPDLWPLFEGLARDRPLALIRGEVSDLISANTAARMAAIAPHMIYAEVPAVGHAPMLNEPEALAALERFLAAAP